MNGIKKTENFCPIRDIMSRFGDKWSMLVLLSLSASEVMRFSELSKAIPDISQKMLTVTLRTLENDGLVSRKIYPEVPPKVEYRITDLGGSLMPHIQGLVDWALKHKHDCLQNRS